MATHVHRRRGGSDADSEDHVWSGGGGLHGVTQKFRVFVGRVSLVK